jgi:ubiquinone/menaquinone biosynthesis C-methylase UbiE
MLNPLYDPLLRLTTRERELRNRLIDHLELKPGDKVLDIGCGTGSLAILAKQRQPEIEVTGIDPDDSILRIARKKSRRAGVEIRYQVASADRLTFPDATFDLVVSSLVFHHLPAEVKRDALREARRVLKPGSRLLIGDFGTARHGLPRLLWFPVRLLDGHKTTADNFEGRMPDLIADAGFADVIESELVRTHVGPVALYRATAPATK